MSRYVPHAEVSKKFRALNKATVEAYEAELEARDIARDDAGQYAEERLRRENKLVDDLANAVAEGMKVTSERDQLRVELAMTKEQLQLSNVKVRELEERLESGEREAAEKKYGEVEKLDLAAPGKRRV